MSGKEEEDAKGRRDGARGKGTGDRQRPWEMRRQRHTECGGSRRQAKGLGLWIRSEKEERFPPRERHEPHRRDVGGVRSFGKRRMAIMPRGDRTGPMGRGPWTGRSAGFCAGFREPGFFGGGRGWRHMFHATGLHGWMRSGWGGPAFLEEPPPDTEKRLLGEEAEVLRSRLDEIRKRLDMLEEGK